MAGVWRYYWCPSAAVIFVLAAACLYERSRFGPERHGDEAVMPARMTGAEELRLYRTPAGRYTAADIVANGNMTAAQKFPAFHARHDFRPRPGDRLCPITRTKANPECAWIVDSKKYEFCCPPCIDEFVRLAQEEPSQVREPDAYVQESSP